MARPVGVSIISILGFLGAILLVISGIALLTIGRLAGSLGGLASIFGILGAAAGAVFLILGIVQFVISYGLWKMKKWGLYIELILLILGILMNIFMAISSPASGIVGIVISAIILYYLYSKRGLFT
jgi:hypothetical protein